MIGVNIGALSAPVPILRRVTNIAEISVIVTGSVALGVPLINGAVATWQAKRSARAQRLDELRSVLDDAAVALLGFNALTVTIESGKLDREAMEERAGQMRAALQNIWEQESRINVRLGIDHEVAKAYRAAHDCAAEYYSWVRDALQGTGIGSTFNVQDYSARLAAAHAQFFNLAAARIGPESA